MQFPDADLYVLNINAKCYDLPVLDVEASHLQVFVDAVYVGSYPLISEAGDYSDVRAFLPVIESDLHPYFLRNTIKSLLYMV